MANRRKRWYTGDGHINRRRACARLLLQRYKLQRRRPQLPGERLFIWYTFTDNAVPVENSLLFVSALRQAGVRTEFHMYPCGGHGLSLANRLTLDRGGSALQEECTSWISMAHTWIEHQYVKGS